LAALVGVGLLLSGCGQSPLGPTDSSQSAGGGGGAQAPPVVTIAPDGTVAYVDAPYDTTLATPGAVEPPAPATVSASAWINGSVGGVVRAGRFGVKIPAGAFAGTAQVTVTMPDSTMMLCDLSISPASANLFKVPVKLVADLASTNLTDASTYTMYWYDPNRVLWKSLVAKSRTSGTLVVTDLDHFSRYASGKAGW
jgi:hypothetical protein